MNSYWTDNSNMKANRHWQGISNVETDIPLDNVTGFLITNGLLSPRSEIQGIYQDVTSTSSDGFSQYVNFYDLSTNKILKNPTMTVSHLPYFMRGATTYSANVIYGYGYTDELAPIFKLKQENINYVLIQKDSVLETANTYTIPFLITVRNYKINSIDKVYSDIINYTFKQGLGELYDNICIIQVKTTSVIDITGYNGRRDYPSVKITFNR